MHAHFADDVLLAGESSETMPEEAGEGAAGPGPVDPGAPSK
jgi:hypothetical protein